LCACCASIADPGTRQRASRGRTISQLHPTTAQLILGMRLETECFVLPTSVLGNTCIRRRALIWHYGPRTHVQPCEPSDLGCGYRVRAHGVALRRLHPSRACHSLQRVSWVHLVHGRYQKSNVGLFVCDPVHGRGAAVLRMHACVGRRGEVCGDAGCECIGACVVGQGVQWRMSMQGHGCKGVPRCGGDVGCVRAVHPLRIRARGSGHRGVAQSRNYIRPQPN
jgi:hypothetical protein